MNDETTFLRAAAAQPDDDTLRLVYADWLDEQGGEANATHAAFVRLQVRRSRLDVFDPDRASLLQEETALLQKHKRDWNGRIHRDLHRRGVFGLVDARRGLIRGWHYHRGMIARVSIYATGLTHHANFVRSLGPIEGLEVSGWRNWSPAEAAALAPVFAGVKVLTLRGAFLADDRHLGIMKRWQLSILDLRRVDTARFHTRELAARARSGDLPPIVLFRQTVMIPQPPRGGYVQQDAHQAVHVIDPHKKWDAMRLWFADFTGEVLSPIRV